MLARSRLAAVCVRRRFLSTATPAELPSREKAPTAVLKPKEARETEPSHQGWVKLHDLPRTISPADVSRHVYSLVARDPEFVHLDYRNFMPSGRAWLRFPDAGIADEALRVLRDSVIAGHKIRAQRVGGDNVVAAGAPARYRGPRGRSEALQRDIIDGHGPDAKLKERGMNVYLWGLPGTMMAPELVKLLDSYGLRVTAEETNPIQKIERKTPTSRFLVRLSTVSGAHRLVRDFHMTEKFEGGYLVHAQIVY